MGNDARILIVGGGLSGLVHAFARARLGEDVVVLDAADEPGGVVRTVEKDGFLLELGPNTVRSTPGFLSLCRDLDLERDLIFSHPSLPRYVELNGRVRKAPFGALSIGAIFRAASEIFRGGGAPLETESAFDFVCRRFGRDVAENLLEPFVAGVFAGDARRLSFRAAFPKVAQAADRSGGVVRGLLTARRPRVREGSRRGLVSFQKGLSTLPRALAGRLANRYRPGIRVDRVTPAGQGWEAVTPQGIVRAEEIVIALPAPEAARVVGSFCPEAARALAEIPSAALLVAHCAWDRDDVGHPLSGFGCLCAPKEGKKILGAVWNSSIFPGRAPQGRVLLTVFLGGRRTPDWAALPEEELPGVIFEALAETLHLRRPPDILRATRYPSSIPQYEIGHDKRVAAVDDSRSRHSGLAFLGSWRGGISVGDVVDNALIISPS